MPYLPYHEPNITTILSLTSFLLLLNSVRYILDQLLYCGIIGEILIGIIWGLPVGGTSWLSTGTQEAIQAYGYLGLIGLVFEGGLKTDLTLLKKSVYLSILVATIGLLMPIGLSFILLAFPFTSSAGMLYPTPLAAFSAGASLCSTSLGTTFAILASAEMQKTKVGVVLVGAAMMDDVVGLVMVNIVTTLGAGGSGGWPIARPIAGSFGMFLVTLLLGSYVLKPAWTVVLGYLRSDEESSTKLQSAIRKLVEKIPHMGFILSTAVLVIYVTIAAFIDSSVLFAAFIAGGVVNFLWSFRNEHEGGDAEGHGSSAMYESYYQAPMDYILVPFFFVSAFSYALFARTYCTGIYRILHPHYRYVSRLNLLERHRLRNFDDHCQSSSRYRRVRLLLPSATTASKKSSNSPSISKRNRPARQQCTINLRSYSGPTARHSSPGRSGDDGERRDRVLDCVAFAELRYAHFSRRGPQCARRGYFPCDCLGCCNMYDCWACRRGNRCKTYPTAGWCNVWGLDLSIEYGSVNI